MAWRSHIIKVYIFAGSERVGSHNPGLYRSLTIKVYMFADTLPHLIPHHQSIDVIKKKMSVGSERTSPILYMEQYIPFSLIICEPFSRILEIL